MLSQEDMKKIISTGIIFISVITLFYVARIATELKTYRTIGSSATPTNTITVSGEGEVPATPDIARIRLGVQADAKTVKVAQENAAVKVNSIIEALTAQGIEAKDITTENYNLYPKYEWQNGRVVCMALEVCPPVQGRQVQIGFEVQQTLVVTVRNLDLVGPVLDAVGPLGITTITGPEFAVDNNEALAAQARKQAIDDAKAKAKVLAKDLGVRTVRIVSFSENNGVPAYYRDAVASPMMLEAAKTGTAVPAGEQKIRSMVSITYEIR